MFRSLLALFYYFLMCRSEIEDIRLLQKNRERKRGLAIDTLEINKVASVSLVKPEGKPVGNEEGTEELVLQDTFAQETAVHVEDPNM